MQARVPTFLTKCSRLIAALALLWCSRTDAVDLLVNNTNDNGADSLQQAIADNKNPGEGNTIIFSSVVTGPANVSGEFQFTDTNAPMFPVRFYRAVSP